MSVYPWRYQDFERWREWTTYETAKRWYWSSSDCRVRRCDLFARRSKPESRSWTTGMDNRPRTRIRTKTWAEVGCNRCCSTTRTWLTILSLWLVKSLPCCKDSKISSYSNRKSETIRTRRNGIGYFVHQIFCFYIEFWFFRVDRSLRTSFFVFESILPDHFLALV